MRDDCLIVAIRLYTGRILHLRTMATVMEQHLIVEGYGWVVDEECFEGMKDSSASSLLVCKHADVILRDAKLVQQENPHRLDIIDTSIEILYAFCLVLIDTDQ